MEPLVSAVIVTHNRIDLLKAAVNSVLCQSWPALELIVVDDGSTDGTRSWMESFAPSHRIDYCRLPAPSGANHARNTGILRAKGKYIALLDDDDEWLPEKIEKQVRLAEADPAVGVVSCGRITVFADGRTETEDPAPLSEGDLSREIFTSLRFTSSRLLIRKDLLEQAGLFDESLRAWQDYELMLRLSVLTRVGVVREGLVRYHVFPDDPGRISNQLEGWQQAVALIRVRYEDRLKALPRETRRAFRLMVCRDGAARAARAHKPGARRRYLAGILLLQPTVENLKILLHAF